MIKNVNWFLSKVLVILVIF